MTTRVALLRGINVGGHNRVAMAELRDLASARGLDNPRTYAQSGNLVFETALDEQGVVGMLEPALRDLFGFEIPVVTRSSTELAKTGWAHPFSDLGLDERLLQVAFLDRVPTHGVDVALDAHDYLPDRFTGRGREIYLAYPNGSGRSKLNQGMLERRLGVRATVRNWRTISQLIALAGSEGP